MTDQPDTDTDTNDAGLAAADHGWSHVGAGHDLLAEPSADELAPPLTDTAPLGLNTHELPWATFERLALSIARDVDGALDVRSYGRPGQAQHGIDLVAFFDEKPTTVYQAKRYQEFKAQDLDTAVKKYCDGERPFDATRFVVMVACEAHDTGVVDQLDSLRSAYPELAIELRDRTALSEILVNQPQIVRRFFGAATCDVFCVANLPAAPAVASPIDPDAVMRGPVRHMGLADDYERASQALADNPDEAAAIFGEIAATLEKSPFAGHAVQLRRQEAAALQQANRPADGFRVRLSIAWRLVDSADLWTAHLLLGEMNKCEADLPADIVRSAHALAEVVQLRREHTGSLEGLAARFDDLEPGDPHHHTAAVAFAEECIVARREDLLIPRSATLTQLAHHQPADRSAQLSSARIRMAMADATCNWHDLANTARSIYDPPVTALVLARHARFNSLAMNPEMATLRYMDAIERATAEGMYGDAASWLYAARTVRARLGLLEGDLDENHRLAQALQTLGVERVITSSDARERALSALLRRKWPDALEALKRFLWHSVVSGSWTEETEANELLGDVFAATGRSLDAARCYLRAGNREKARQLGSSLPEERIDLSTELLGRPPWERAAAYRFVAQVADLLVDASALTWGHLALDDAVANPAPSRFGDTLGADALEAFAALSECATEADAERFLHFADSLVDRQPNQHRFTDESHMRALVGIGTCWASPRTAALRQALRLLLVDDRLGRILLTTGGKLLQHEVQLVEELLAAPATQGNGMACLGLIVAEADTTPALAYAKDRLVAATAERVHEPGVQHFGTEYGLDAPLVSVLETDDRAEFVRGVMAVALDTAEPKPNREDALLAAAKVVADLSPDTRGEIHREAIEFARGHHDPKSPGPLDGPADPLSRFQFNLGPHSLRPAGLLCAARSAVGHEEGHEVQELALGLLHEAGADASTLVAHALHALPSELVSGALEVLSAHSSEQIRALAAVSWAAGSEHAGALGERLARDGSPLVRRSLAGALQDRSMQSSVLEVLQDDPRRSVRRLVSSRTSPDPSRV